MIAPTPGIVVSRRMSSSRFASPTPSFELVDLTRQRLDLTGDFSQSQTSGFWQANVRLVADDLDQRSHFSRAEGGNFDKCPRSALIA